MKRHFERIERKHTNLSGDRQQAPPGHWACAWHTVPWVALGATIMTARRKTVSAATMGLKLFIVERLRADGMGFGRAASE